MIAELKNFPKKEINTTCGENGRDLLTSPNLFPIPSQWEGDEAKEGSRPPLISESQLPLSLKPPLPLEEELGTGMPFPPLDISHDSFFITNLLNDAELQMWTKFLLFFSHFCEKMK